MKKKIRLLSCLCFTVLLLFSVNIGVLAETAGTQEALTDAYEKILDSFAKDENGYYQYPEDYAGTDTAVLEVYAGWRELDGFVCNDAGHIISCAGGSVIDGIFSLPSDAACTGIEAGALSSVAGLITEVYIPANITYIGPGVFDGLGSLMYIEAAPGNPNYYSAGGVLYTMSGEVVAAPVWF